MIWLRLVFFIAFFLRPVRLCPSAIRGKDFQLVWQDSLGLGLDWIVFTEILDLNDVFPSSLTHESGHCLSMHELFCCKAVRPASMDRGGGSNLTGATQVCEAPKR